MELDYKDVMIAVTIITVFLGSILTALGLWEIRRQRKQA